MSAAAQAGKRVLSEQRYFLAATGAIAALVFAGFARSYYLRGITGLPSLPLRLHLHGAVMTAWVAVLTAQVLLVRIRRLAWHRMLGWAGTGVAFLVVLSGCAMTLGAARRALSGHTSDAAVRLTVLGLELTQMALFATLVISAVWLRHNAGAHKRLMLLATLCLLPSPISRLPINFERNSMILFWFDVAVLAVVAVDCWRLKRLHPAFGWGGALLVGGLTAAFFGAYTATWLGFASWLVG